MKIGKRENGQCCICNKVEPKYKGKFWGIDIERGEYEMSGGDLATSKRRLATDPNAVIYGVQIGSPTAYRIGGHLSVKTQ